MFSWKFQKRDPGSKATELPNPKVYKWVKVSNDEDQQELLTIFMKVKGKCYLYKDILDAQVWKIIKLKTILSKDVAFNEVIEVCHILTELSYKKLVTMRLLNLTQIYKFAVEGIDKIYDLEKNLIRKLEAKDHKAGIDRMNKFSDLITLKTIADFYNETLELAEQRPYKDCYAVWMMKKVEADISHAYTKLN